MSGTDFEAERSAMVVRHLRARDIVDERVIHAMVTVPREAFVPADFQAFAYADRPLPIGDDQTISQPYIVALMTQLLELDPADRVLEIGTGCGYQTAVLAELAADVYSIEVRPALSASAARRLARLGYEGVHLEVGDGTLGCADHAPFDAIVAACATTAVPRPLIDQLAEGGRLVVPVEDRFGQTLTRIRRRNDAIVLEKICSVRFVPMIST